MIKVSSSSCSSHNIKKPMIIFINYFTHFLLLSFFSLNSVISYASHLVSYSDHCSLIVPNSSPKLNTNPPFPLGHFHTGYGGGSEIFKQTSSIFSKSFVFRTRNAYYTDTKGVLKVEADFLFPSGRPKVGRDLVRLFLEGFWSESSGKLCMIGSSNVLDLKAVLKLENVNNLSSVTSLIRGSLECLNSNDGSYCFEPISILMLPQLNYAYTLVSKEFDVVKSLPFSSIPEPSFCNEGWWPPNGFNLKYGSDCGSAKNCSPFGKDLPHVLFINGFGCLNKDRKLRVLVEFVKSSSNGFYQPFFPNKTLVGEGYWDEKKLFVVSCRFFDIAESLASARLEDCSTRLSLSFSTTLSIRKTGNIEGEIWSNKTVNDPTYFENIIFRSSENRIVGVPGLKYEYTETEKVRKLCPRTQPVKNYRVRYPNGNSIHMRFDISVRSSEGKIAWGYAIPFSVGAQFFEKHLDKESVSLLRPANSEVNISYKIVLSMLPDVKNGEGISLFTSSSTFNEVEISAEGFYNEKSGSLCMVGCRSLELDNQTDADSLDCEILLKFQFSPLGEEKNEVYIKGSIESLREKSDPLYFEQLEASSPGLKSSAGYTFIQAKEFIWRMDMEIAMAIISSTLASVFVGLQHLHIKRKPEVLPLISLVMLLIPTLGHLMPLVLNLSSLFLQKGDLKHHFLSIERSFEVNEVIVNLLDMVAFFFQFRLLQLTWKARFVGDERHKGLWLIEKTTLLVSLTIYAGGALFALLLNWGENRLDLKTYVAVILDGFLLPQILLNFFRNSKENALAGSFYIGNTFLRLLPHVYNLYEAHISLIQFSPFEVIIVLGGLILAAVIYLQQQYGGNFILSQKTRAGNV